MHGKVCHEEVPHALDQRLSLRGSFWMPLHAHIARERGKISMTNAFDQPVGRRGPSFKFRCEAVDSLVVMRNHDG